MDEYKLLTGYHRDELEVLVNSLSKKGWKLISFGLGKDVTSNVLFCVAMVKEPAPYINRGPG